MIALWRSEKIRFLAIGAFNTGFGYLTFVALYFLFNDLLHYLVVAAIAHMLSVVVAFLGHRHLVFRSDESWTREFLRYNLSLGVVLLGGLAGLYVLVDQFGMTPPLAQALVMATSIAGSYLAHRHFSFRPPRPRA